MNTSIELELARLYMAQYDDEADRWQAVHQEAMECRDCEDWLRKGIEAYRWICRADHALATADQLGVREMTDVDSSAVSLLYRRWLENCEPAEHWIADLHQRGWEPENLLEFRRLSELARVMAEHRASGQFPALCAELAMSDFVVTQRDADAVKQHLENRSARVTCSVTDHGIVED